ncbi:hypothetical protein SGCOL_006761 [Colletotrichum sp. CLE4]
MSPTSKLFGLFSLAATAQAACSNFMIDDFSRSSVGGTNKLNSWTSDDGSMSKVAISNGALTFTPKTDTSSYFYETLGCVKATTKGYKALSLSITGPKDASMLLEIQSRTTCSDNTYKSQWVTISGLTGSQQTVTISLSSFTEANLDAITGFVWSTYSQFSSDTGFEQLSVKLNSFGRYHSHFGIIFIRNCTSCKHRVERRSLFFLDVSQVIGHLSEYRCQLQCFICGKHPGQQYIFGSLKCPLIILIHLFGQGVNYLQLRHFSVVACFIEL